MGATSTPLYQGHAAACCTVLTSHLLPCTHAPLPRCAHSARPNSASPLTAPGLLRSYARRAAYAGGRTAKTRLGPAGKVTRSTHYSRLHSPRRKNESLSSKRAACLPSTDCARVPGSGRPRRLYTRGRGGRPGPGRRARLEARLSRLPPPPASPAGRRAERVEGRDGERRSGVDHRCDQAAMSAPAWPAAPALSATCPLRLASDRAMRAMNGANGGAGWRSAEVVDLERG